MNRSEIFERVRDTLSEYFEIPPAEIRLESHLRDDLDLDSVDAIDMAVRLQDLTATRFEEESLKNLQTVGDTVDLIERLMAAR